MELTLGNFSAWAGYMFLIVLRVISTFALSPVFGRSVPAIAKIVFSVLFSLLIFNMFPMQETMVFANVLEYAVACMKEIILGFIFSFIIVMFLSFVYTVGHIIDTQMGFSFSQIYDPLQGYQMPLSGTFLNVVIVLVFFITDAHHTLFKVLFATFAQLPPGQVVFNQEFVKAVIQVFILSFKLAVQVSMPIFVTSIVVELLLGVVMKAVPQIHFFVIGFPVKIMIGLVMLVVFLPVFVNMSDYIIEDMFSAIQKIFEEMSMV